MAFTQHLAAGKVPKYSVTESEPVSGHYSSFARTAATCCRAKCQHGEKIQNTTSRGLGDTFLPFDL